ncbi:MAG: DUF1015 domain-containing protein [Candidatus Omnitrophota bacterium]|nr:DUF1015 domain-containing protein [Candidatus Omnitrophota bacterium]
MAHTLKPLSATHYNQSIIKDLSLVTCPPYDVINKKQEFALKHKSPYNFCNVLLTDNGNYKELGKRFRQWISENILIDDAKESLYLYEQKFKMDGKKYSRFGILTLLKMDGKGAIFPHEYTLKAPKEDRKKIIREVKANLSPIFVIAPKSLKTLAKIHEYYSKKKSFVAFKDSDGNDNKVWKINDRVTIERICNEFDGHKLVIADGHHRFEVSYGYYKKNKNRFKDLNYILAYVTDAQKGLVILPTHRIVSVKNIAAVMDKLREYFDIKKVDEKDLEEKLKHTKGFCFGVYHADNFHFIKLKSERILDKIFKGSVYRKLDTYLLHQFVFPICGIEGDVQYTHNIAEAKKIAARDKTAFILKPTALGDVFKIANQGYRLPQKSTYFYPKVSSGIVVRRFEKR